MIKQYSDVLINKELCTRKRAMCESRASFGAHLPASWRAIWRAEGLPAGRT